jgi:hypothetical protein
MERADSPYLPITWASDIEADFLSKEELLVTGKLPTLESDWQSSRDAFRRYLTSVKLEFGQKGTGRPSPHLTFGNAVSDDALIGFVGEFGPVVAKDVVEIEPTQPEWTSLEDRDKFDWRTSIGAVQEMATLRRERQIYASALELLAELRCGEDAASIKVIRQHISVIADGASYWPQQWEAEKEWRASHSPAPIAWHFDTNRSDYLRQLEYDAYHREPPGLPSSAKQELDAPLDTPTDFASCENPDDPSTWSFLLTRPYTAGHLVLCQLINAFDTQVWCCGDRAVEVLPHDSLRFGIRPALYQILKHMYLGRVGAHVCRNDRCRQLFESQREGQVFCNPDCSQQDRQRQYWTATGSEQRKKRRSGKRSSLKRKKRAR